MLAPATPLVHRSLIIALDVVISSRSQSESTQQLMDSHGDMMAASFTSSNGQYGGYSDRTAPPPEIPPRSPARASYPMSPTSVPSPIHPPDNGAVQGNYTVGSESSASVRVTASADC